MPLIEKSCDALNVRLDEISSKGQSIDIQKYNSIALLITCIILCNNFLGFMLSMLCRQYWL